jgi:filamentous hemagglutinin
LSSTASAERQNSERADNIGSTISATSVNVVAGKDIKVTGSSVVSDQATTLIAKNNVTIEAARNTLSQNSFHEETQSGLFSGGGIGFTIGSRSQTDQYNTNGTSQSQSRSMVGSTGGNVVIQAGQDAKVSGSDVVAAGNIDITGKNVRFDPGTDQLQSSESHEFKQSGVSVSLSGGILSAATTAVQTAQAAAGAKNKRVLALNALQSYAKGSDAVDTAKAMGSAASPGDAAAASGIRVSVSAGSSQSKSESSTSATANSASTALAGGNLTISATQGDITAVGATLGAQNVSLDASKNVNLQAATDSTSNRGTNSNSSASVDLSFGIGGQSTGLSLDIAAAKGKGVANGDSASQQNTTVTAKNQVSIKSGADTNVQGAQVSGERISTNVGGNLNLASAQDSATYAANQSNAGFAVSIPIYGTGGSASISSSKSQTDANYQSVNQQSGLFAGSGGYDIKVKGNTDLQGAVIDSTASADKNQLTTASLTHGDIQNSLSASSSTSGTTLGTGMLSGNYAAAKGIAGNLLDRGAASASDASTAKSAIAQGTLTLTGAQPSTDISRDTRNTNRALAKPDIAGLQNAAQEQRADGNLLFATATAVSDPINRAMTADKKIVLQKCDGPGGTNCTQTQVDASQVKAGSDGKIYVFNNGIMNNEADAQSNAAKQSSDTANKQGVYVIINPYTGNAVSEVLYAGVDKLNELTGGNLPISNASQANIDLRNQASAVGGTVIDVDHSRGTLTSSNATATQVNSGQNNVPLGSVTFNGGAANAERGANLLQQATQNAPSGPGTQLQAMHVDDPVGTLIGGNDSTGGVPGQSLGKAHGTYGPNASKVDQIEVWGSVGANQPIVVKPTSTLVPKAGSAP